MSQLIEILEKFENGEIRYMQDPRFSFVIGCLFKGVGVYAVLDSTLKNFAKADTAMANTAEALRLALHEKAELTEALAKLEKENRVLTDGLVRCGTKITELETNLKQYESI